MCGICAYIGSDAAGYRVQLELNIQALCHRGPDGSGRSIRGNVALGQTRLCIVGDAEHGAQPVVDERYSLVFNGEVHNYLELARELTSAGVEVDTASDTAVLFALLRREGAACLPRLRGFWAFVFVDHVARRAMVCRDRYGQKPLVYTRIGRAWSFASEAAGLGPALSVDHVALSNFIHSAQYPAAPDTFYLGVKQVEPGTYIELDLGTLTETQSRYYRPVAGKPLSLSFEQATAAFAERFECSLKLRLRADVPVGLMLSAGKDSGSLAALLAGRERRVAFTFANGAPDDESEEVGRWYGRDFRLEKVPQLPSEQALRQNASRLHRTLDAPLASGSLLALDRLYSAARRSGVPVVLSGQGADELLGGYNYYSSLQSSPGYRLLARLRSLGGIRGAIAAGFDVRAATSLVAPFPRRLGGAYASPPDAGSPDAVTARRVRDITGYQLQTMIWYEDRIAMSHGIEARYPFLDVDLVDLALALPGAYCVRGFARKRLLQAAFGERWPEALRRERQKRGLPAAETSLIQAYPTWFADGLEAAFRAFGLPSPTVDMARVKSPRLAKTVFRLAAVGHWLEG